MSDEIYVFDIGTFRRNPLLAAVDLVRWMERIDGCTYNEPTCLVSGNRRYYLPEDTHPSPRQALSIIRWLKG